MTQPPNCWAASTRYVREEVIFGFWTNKIFKEFDELLAAGKQVEEYDMEQLRTSAGKDVREHFCKINVRRVILMCGLRSSDPYGQ